MESEASMLLAGATGLGFTMLGGYVERVASQREYYQALLTGVVVLALGELLAVPAALLGGHLQDRKTQGLR